jgi:D-beta-D-heptose 7-phosphate kinase/D-beta-D-heptose 1-phosphate adenosyltransferase
VICDFVVEKSARSICKLRVMAQHQQLIRMDFEDTPIKFDRKSLEKSLVSHFPENNVVVFSDYGKGTLADVSNYIDEAKRAGIKVLVDPKGTDYQRYAKADLITPNQVELQAVVGACISDQELIEKGRTLLVQCQIPSLLLTRGEAGVMLVEKDSVHSLPAQAKDVFDVTGAGDTVIAVMALGVSLELPLCEAMYVGKVGTSTVSQQDLNQAMHGDRDSQYGIVSEAELSKVFARAKAHDEKIVMTNGCFDLLHVGHVTYLEQAKALGDRLCVAVNSDESVKRLKGESRPINGVQERMAVLAALACVDWVVEFTEETPERLYCNLLPDIIVKGGDYRSDQVVGGDCVIKAGGEVKILQFVDGQSTTSMINKARQAE